MFRVLSEDEARRVTRWQAPELKGPVPIANTRQVATPVRLGESLAGRGKSMTDREGGQSGLTSGSELHSSESMSHGSVGSDQGTSAGGESRTAGIPMPGQSADMLQSSYDEGYACGFAEGNAQLHQQSVQQLQALVETLGKPALQVPDAELEQEVLALSLGIARLVLGRELEVDEAALSSLVRRGIAQLPNAGNSEVQVHLHPLDAGMMSEVTQLPDNVDIVEDGSLDRSDCRIVSGASTVHSGMDDWLAIIAAELGMTSGLTPRN